ncbi:hypothetical protein LXL04_039498 [Taraxacum kok-saghyz]
MCKGHISLFMYVQLVKKFVRQLSESEWRLFISSLTHNTTKTHPIPLSSPSLSAFRFCFCFSAYWGQKIVKKDVGNEHAISYPSLVTMMEKSRKSEDLNTSSNKTSFTITHATYREHLVRLFGIGGKRLAAMPRRDFTARESDGVGQA